ncbi:hypothetical protein CRUP_037602, partial [Coryphaenoides rupestris]
PLMKERPSSAIYPSDSLRQSLLGSRRVRTGLSLAKSVSTNNIAGCEDSPVGLRRILSQSSDSLNFRNRAMSLESLTDEGELYYASLLEDLQEEGRCVCADSWSVAVDHSFLQSQRKDVIKRQDVIYELIQTEFHHVRTLRIMDGVYRRGMLEEVMLEPGVVHAVFPCLDQLLGLHQAFLALMMTSRTQALAPGSHTNFTIQQLGDLLLNQPQEPTPSPPAPPPLLHLHLLSSTSSLLSSLHLLSSTSSTSTSSPPPLVSSPPLSTSSPPPPPPLLHLLSSTSSQSAEDIRKVYSEFCSRHPKAVKLYKELLARDKRFQLFIRECILLVTQRITKYPVLIQRILDNTKGNEEEVQSLSTALRQLKDLITAVDQEVLELERTERLQEIQARLDPRAQTEVSGRGGVFRGGELLRRRLVHDGTLLWKIQGQRMKDLQVLLMSDILVFLQDKDQKFIFPTQMEMAGGWSSVGPRRWGR